MPSQLDKFVDEESQAILPSPEVALKAFLESTSSEDLSASAVIRAAAAAKGFELPDYADLDAALADASAVSERDEAEYDVWRDSPARLLGYANELGESFRPVLPRLVVPSYMVAGAYVCADTLHKTRRAVDQGCSAQQTAAIALDTLVWQTFASVLIPGLLINRMVRVASMSAARLRLPPVAQRWGPTLVGLAIIPALVQPVDFWVHNVMNKWRPALNLPTHG